MSRRRLGIAGLLSLATLYFITLTLAASSVINTLWGVSLSITDPGLLVNSMFRVLVRGESGPIAGFIVLIAALNASIGPDPVDSISRKVLTAYSVLLSVSGVALCFLLEFILFTEGGDFIDLVKQEVRIGRDLVRADATQALSNISTAKTCFGGFIGLFIGLKSEAK